MKMVYQWKEGGDHWGCDAQSAGEHLEELRKASGKLFTTQVIVDDAAANVNCPYRGTFEWDDAKAANFHRCSQARTLLGLIEVTVTHDNTEQVSAPIRAFVSLKRTHGDDGIPTKQNFESIVEVMSDEDKRRMLMSKALGELNSWRLRYQALAEFAKLFTFIDALTAKLGDKIGYVQHTDRAEDSELQEVRGDD